MRVFRSLVLLELGAWAGMATAAAFAKRAMPSRGDEDSDEVALVAIFDGIELKNRAKAFRGGSAFSWFGGIALDLSEAELAPDAHLSLHTFLGGIAVKVPDGWRVESDVNVLAGGVDVKTPADESPDAPTLKVDGMALFGGIAVKGAGPAAEPEPAPAAE